MSLDRRLRDLERARIEKLKVELDFFLRREVDDDNNVLE